MSVFNCPLYTRSELGYVKGSKDLPQSHTEKTKITNPVNITVGTVDQKVLDKRDDRRSLNFYNTGPGVAYIAFGRQATTADTPIAAGSPYFSDSGEVSNDELHVLSASTSQLSIIEVYRT